MSLSRVSGWLFATLALLGAGWACAAEKSEIHFRWRLATSWSPEVPVLGSAALRFSRYLTMVSGGRIDAQVEDPAYHRSPNGVFEMVKSGTHEMGITATHYPRGRESAGQLVASLSFAMSDSERLAWYYAAGGLQQLQAAYASEDVVPFPIGGAEIEAGLWTRRELRSSDDLSGLRLRVPGRVAAAYANLGVKAIHLPAVDVADVLGRGRLDACEWPALSPEGMGRIVAAANYFYPAWRDPEAELMLFIGQAKYEALPEDLQLAVRIAAKALAVELAAESAFRNREQAAALKSGRVSVRPLAKEILASLARAHDEALRDAATRLPAVAEALRARQAFLARSVEWDRSAP